MPSKGARTNCGENCKGVISLQDIKNVEAPHPQQSCSWVKSNKCFVSSVVWICCGFGFFLHIQIVHFSTHIADYFLRNKDVLQATFSKRGARRSFSAVC